MSERVLILGMARSGRAAARLLRGRGRRVLLSDLRLAQEDLPEDLRDLPFLGGEFREEWLDEADTLLLSPGIPLDAAPAKANYLVGWPPWRGKKRWTLAKGFRSSSFAPCFRGFLFL